MTNIQTYKTDRKRVDIPKLKNEETCKEYQDKLEDRLHGSVHSNTGETETDQEWAIIKQTIIDSAIETVDMEKCRRNEWFDEECKQEMNKNEAYNNYLKRPTRAKRIIYEVARRKTNILCRQKKRTEMNKTLLDIEEKFQGRHIRRLKQ
jgi:hypothetical protein